MSNNKIIDLDPQKRLSKEMLAYIQTSVASFTVDNLENFCILYMKKGEGPTLEAFGVDWYLLGIAQAYLENLRASLLAEGDEDVK